MKSTFFMMMFFLLLSPKGRAGDPVSHHEVGRRLFFDVSLSANRAISCSACHRPEKYFQDGRGLSQGVHGQIGTRNAPSLLTAAQNTSQFWDGRRTSLEAQALDPMLNPSEHGLANAEAVLAVIRRDPDYLAAFRKAYGRHSAKEITLEDVRHALAAFQRSLVVNNAPFDGYLYKDKKAALSESAQRGLQLFQGRAQCSSCHTMEGKPAFFSDNRFHSLSVGLASVSDQLPALTQRLIQARQKGELDFAVLSDKQIAALGRFVVTLKPADIGKFRTPSLRNVAMTAPYMHDGSIATLEEAVEVEIYYRSTEAGRPLILTPAEKADLVEFLNALTTPLADVLKQAGLPPPQQQAPAVVSP